MRLAVISLMSGLQWGGSEELWHALAGHALKQGDNVLVSIYDWGSLHEKVELLKSKGAIICTRKKFNANAGFVERLARFVKARRPSLDRDYQAIIDFRPDVIFISQGESFDLAIHHRSFYNLIRKHAVPYSFVCHSHEQYSFFPPKEIFPGASEIFQNARFVYFVSNRQKKLTERRLAMTITNAILTWNPLNIELPLSPLPWPEMERINFAIVGNLSGAKGHDTAFEALSSGTWRDRNWQLNIYGSGDGINYLKALACFFQIEDKINFKGYTRDIIGVWLENHALLIPSAGEGMPISLVEAMACGRIAVATDVGGISEVLADAMNGFLAASPAAESFSVAMEKAWAEKENWKQLGLYAFKTINKVLNKNPEEKIYQEMTSQKQHLE